MGLDLGAEPLDNEANEDPCERGKYPPALVRDLSQLTERCYGPIERT